MPAVTEVVEAVARTLGIPPERRGEVFRAAQQTCAEELRLTRTGFSPATLSELAERAVRLLPADLGGERIGPPGWNEEAPFPEEPPAETATPFDAPESFWWEPEEPPAAEVLPASATPARDDSLERSDAVSREIAAEAPGTEEEEEETPAEIEFDTIDRRPAPRGGKLAVFLLVVAIAGGVWFFSKTRRAPGPPPAGAGGETTPAGPEARPPTSATAPAAAGSTPTPPAAAPSSPPPAPAIPESHGSTMRSPDWTGPPVWMIHFSSYQRKENAERDASRLGKLLGRPLRVVGVHLGAQGLWYRVMLGEFASREDAQAERDRLAAKGTPGLGFVYRVEGVPPPRAAAP